jgi:hypothetical protein
MPEKFKLARTSQCKKCPWKVSTDPRTIPDGYCEIAHARLENTIADPGDPVGHYFAVQRAGQIVNMACHHSSPGKEQICVGWLVNQIGPGNNIALRMKMRDCENIRDLKTAGEQHEHFKDTLPKQ